MGNIVYKSRSNRNDIDIGTPPVTQSRRFGSLNSDDFSECSFPNLIRNLSTPSFISLGSTKSSHYTENTNRPWSRVSRRQWSERTISNPLVSSKTAWPVSLMESLFLPEFKVQNNISEEAFSLIGNISTGAFGKVYKVQKKDNNKIYAMKVLSKCKIVASNSVKQVKDEVKIQQLVGHHSFIVNCPFFWQSKKKLYIVSEYVSGGELLKLVQDHGPLKARVIQIYLSEIAIALDFLHNAGVIYRDLKLENILLDSNNHIQIIDFGLSKWLKYGSRTNTLCGTLQYIAPEILKRESYGHAVDWWSLGIVFYCMLTGQCPYPCPLDENGEVHEVPQIECDRDAEDLLRSLLTVDPVRRLHSLHALKRTAFFKGFDFDKRPFIIEEPKTKEERSVSCQVDDRYCRICFDDKKKEIPIMACRCKGTIGLVHMSCLEKWLAMSNTHSCELCGYNYQTVRTPRYRVLYSIYYWVFLDRNPQYHRGLKSDFIVFVVLTPIAFVGVYSCIIAADFYSKEPHKYSPASRWTTISLLIMVVLLTFAYYLWVAVTIRFHMRIWYIWWQANNIVKVIPRDPEAAQSTESTSSRRIEATPSCGASLAETQIPINEYV